MSPHSIPISWRPFGAHLAFIRGDDTPVSLERFTLSDGTVAPLVTQTIADVFTADEQRGRTSQGYDRSAVGQRLRYADHTETADADSATLRIVQRDPRSHLEVTTQYVAHPGAQAVSVSTSVTNRGDRDVVVLAVTSATLAFTEAVAAPARVLTAASEWLAEGRWSSRPLRGLVPDLQLDAHGQDSRGRFSVDSHGSWSSGEYLPVAVLETGEGSPSVGWQIETSAGWHWELTQAQGPILLNVLGATDLEHQFATRLTTDQTFTSVPVAIAVGAGVEGVFAALTAHRRAIRDMRPADLPLPVIYNDYMNTLMGQPTTEQLLPLISAAAQAGAELFCIDAGWFTDRTDYWSHIGEWREAPTRFTGGLRRVTDAIHAAGMGPGLWLEPEVIGVDSPAATQLPEEAFFQRFGTRVVEDRRYHLDFRHPAARAHLDNTVDFLVETYGVSYFKLDYNINPGPGTETNAAAAGEGLLGHTIAFREWLRAAQNRHPQVLFENCSSGAMRTDYSLLQVAHIQSTSDQQDAVRYAPIAASAPTGMLPEQAGNWAYPAATMSDGETAFTLVSGLAGRLMLAGFLHELRPGQLNLVHEAVALHRDWRTHLATSVPRWPLGLPGWEDPVIALALDTAQGSLVNVWSRGEGGTVALPGVGSDVLRVFPEAARGWIAPDADGTLALNLPAGVTACTLVVGASGR